MTSILRFPAFAALLLAVMAAAPAPADKPTTELVISRLSGAIENLKTLRCTVKAQERLDGKYQQARSTMKIMASPLKIYVRNQKGVEVLWVTGQNNGDAWVNPNAFPYVTLNLDPKGSVMRRNQHHSVLNAGFGTIADLLHGSPLRQDRTYERSFRYTGDSTVAGRACHVLRSDYPQFRYVTYKTTKAESISRIADRFGCGEYRIVERNGLAVDETVPAGKTLQVPNSYGRRTIVCVDQKTFLPTVVQVNDDKGLFEKFEFSEVIANQPIPAAEFTKEYKDYKF
ncbi:LysM peptidoglycan-binding domain-containing protein [Hymenobacter lucidus]|uniref:DUF1571 domain-containing protein n=1 Tax=Hymenobacter lucidus TaxID=2880930 RepID=A0ABS8AYP8_9BACT|nr:DUF1571 domain-containing protein [Hymenobacter lucidus]MCB2410894.1 DUF1571 domain-containing protein [Hymenobacter lucidus]